MDSSQLFDHSDPYFLSALVAYVYAWDKAEEEWVPVDGPFADDSEDSYSLYGESVAIDGAGRYQT